MNPNPKSQEMNPPDTSLYGTMTLALTDEEKELGCVFMISK